MNEKKEMQIVVTADDSQAKTKLQKLSDFLKNNFRKEETKVDLNTNVAKAKLIQVNDTISKLKNEIKNIDAESDSNNFKLWADQLADAELGAEKLKNVLKETDDVTKNVSGDVKHLANSISSSFEKASKKTKRFVLSLFSVRTAWSLISRVSQTYLSENEGTASKVEAAWSYLGNLVGPIVEKVVSWLQYGIAYLNVFIKALFGVDLLAKSIRGSISKTNKEMKKTLSEMDEIVNLQQQDSGPGSAANALQDIANLQLNDKIVKFLEDLADSLSNVWDWAQKAWSFLEENFGTAGAAAIVGGLALIIGGAGAGGVYGLLAALTAIASVKLVTLIDQFEKLNTQIDKEYEAEKKALASKIALYNYYKQQYESSENEEDRAYYLDKMKSAYEKMADTLETSNVDLSETVDLAEGWSDCFDETKSLAEQIEDATKSAKDTLDGIDDSTVKVEFKMDADTTLAESKTGSWFNRLGAQLKYAVSEVWSSVKFAFTGKAYASGGTPGTGQMFVANERGPELVGNIGSQTAVINNQQIVASVSTGVANAVAGVLGSQKNNSSSNASYIYLDGREFARAIYEPIEDERIRRSENTSIRRA